LTKFIFESQLRILGNEGNFDPVILIGYSKNLFLFEAKGNLNIDFLLF